MAIMNGELCPFNVAKIIPFIEQFEKYFIDFKNGLKKCFIKQKLVWYKGVIYSDFVPDVTKIKNDSIDFYGDEDFSDEEKNAYRSLVESEGVALSMTEAEELCNEIAQLPEIPFAYTADGCYARAHEIADYVKKRGCERIGAPCKVGKVWLVGELKDPNDPTRTWGYHVAAIIFVRQGTIIVPMVIDPSPSNNKLLSVDAWLSLNYVTVKPREIVYPAPEHSRTFESMAIMYSSSRPLWPSSWDKNETDEERLEMARQDMKNYKQKLTGEISLESSVL